VKKRPPAPTVTPYQFFMLTLCVWALAVLAADTFVPLDDATRTILAYADTAVCVLFLFDFANSFARAPRKMHYMMTWGWIDLLSSIPMVNQLRIGRAARLMRLLRVLRGVKSARSIAHYLVSRRAESAVLASVLLCLVILVSCSIAILQFEMPATNGNIKSADDALWWAMSTMTTVGYGDRYPVTSEGRVVAVFLMAAGVGAFGTLSGLVASWFLSPAAEETDSDLAEVNGRLKDIQERLERIDRAAGV
jgi:voltage-gated potassium channel